MLLVGSAALRFFNVFGYDRKIIDYDFFCTKPELLALVTALTKSAENKLISIKYSEDKSSAAVFMRNLKSSENFILDVTLMDVEHPLLESNLQIVKRNSYVYDIDIMGVDIESCVASPETVYLMKMSHRFKKNSVHFKKTMQDIHTLRNWEYLIWDVVNSDKFKKMLALREQLTYNYGHPKLNTTKKEFFTDSVPYKYDHDSIHEAVKHLDKPAYQYYMKDNEQVLTSKDKFDTLPEIVKLYGVLEESYVLAIERAIVPHNTDPEKAFDIALEKVCTSITSGWFREYAWENYNKVKAMYHSSFVTKFEQALTAGKILSYNAV